MNAPMPPTLGLPDLWEVPVAWGRESVVLELVAGYAPPSGSLPAATAAAPPHENRVEGRSACHPHMFLRHVVLLLCTSNVW